MKDNLHNILMTEFDHNGILRLTLNDPDNKNALSELMIQKLINPLMSECFKWDEIPSAHTKMMNNKHLPGNMAALVLAKKTGLKTLNKV